MKVSDEEIVAALLANPSNAEAAKAVGISERYLYTRMQAKSFKELLAAATDRVFDDTLNKAKRALMRSLDVMAAVMDDPAAPPQVRLNAAEAIQRSATRMAAMTKEASPWAELDRALGRF